MDGKKISNKRVLADLVWQGVISGEVKLPNEKRVALEPREWLDLVKWLHTHVDGPARTELDINQTGSMNVEVTAIDYRAAIAPLAPRSMDDSE